jgi:hypothetical protein
MQKLKELRRMGYGNRHGAIEFAIHALYLKAKEQKPNYQEPYVYVRPSYIRFSQPAEGGTIWVTPFLEPAKDGFVWLVETEFDTPRELFRYLSKVGTERARRREYGGSFDYYQDDHFISIYATQEAFDAATELYKSERATIPNTPIPHPDAL